MCNDVVVGKLSSFDQRQIITIMNCCKYLDDISWKKTILNEILNKNLSKVQTPFIIRLVSVLYEMNSMLDESDKVKIIEELQSRIPHNRKENNMKFLVFDTPKLYANNFELMKNQPKIMELYKQLANYFYSHDIKAMDFRNLEIFDQILGKEQTQPLYDKFFEEVYDDKSDISKIR